MTSAEAKRTLIAIQTLLAVEPDGKVGQKTHAALDALDTLSRQQSLNASTPQPLNFSGRMSTFGGPDDLGVKPAEGLAAWDGAPPEEIRNATDPRGVSLFLNEQPSGTSGLARRLNPEAYYCAYRWDTHIPRSQIRAQKVRLSANGNELFAVVADWGPNIKTGRVIDLSTGAADRLGLRTDEVVRVEVLEA